MKASFLFILLFFPVLLFGQKDRAVTPNLFSPGGDTVLLFGGSLGDSLYFSICRRSADTLARLERFTVATTDKNNSLIPDMIRKYNLTVEGLPIDPDSCKDIQVTQAIISNKKVKRSVTEPSNNIYKAIFSVNVSICNKPLVKDFKATKQYMNINPDNTESLDHTTFYAIKMKGKNTYVLQAQICDTWYENDKTDKEILCVYSTFFQSYLVHCP